MIAAGGNATAPPTKPVRRSVSTQTGCVAQATRAARSRVVTAARNAGRSRRMSMKKTVGKLGLGLVAALLVGVVASPASAQMSPAFAEGEYSTEGYFAIL